jgi:malonyl-CoA/methylmalonyl-CoA synthetase
VCAQVDKSARALFLYFAVVRAGAVYVPLNTQYTAAEVSYFLADAAPALLVCDPSREGELAAAAAGAGVRAVLTLDSAGAGGSLPAAAAAAPPWPGDVARGPGDLASLLYTSGTTGRSKGAELTHGNLAANAAALAALWRFTPADVLLHALPIYHIHGLFVAVHVAMVGGASMLFLPAFKADDALRALASGAATVMMGVPTFYVRLLALPGLDAPACARARLFVCGSAPLLPDTFEAWHARTGHRILERYGMTETGMNTSNPYEPAAARRPGTIGTPLPGVELRVCAVDGGASATAELPRGDVGMIQVRGPNVFRGYWRQPEKTAAEFTADGFFVTGDVGSHDADGFVAISGREKDLVITGGLNVYPREVEAAIDALPGVLESAVFGVPHADFGEGVTAAVVRAAAQPAHGAVDAKAVADALRGTLAKFKQPKTVVFLDELPRNAMGKVQKNALREQFKHLYA